MKNDYESEEGQDFPLEEEQEEKPEIQLTKQESRLVALGALKGGLLIGLVYLAAGALLIWLLLAFWG